MKNYALCIAHCALLLGCTSSDDTSETKMQEMPIVITLPAEQFTNPHDFETSTGGDATTKASNGATRADLPGDPGKYESFSLPTDLYIFIYVQETATQNAFTYSHIGNIGADQWVKTTAGTDSVYRYNSSIPFDIPAQREAIKVYAAAWNRPLTLKKGATTISSSSDITSEEDIKGITFDLDNSNLQDDIENLQNLYSSPYNYNNANGKYYGTMKDPESAQPNIDLMLYHVASKLDLMWNVQSDKQDVAKVGEVSAVKMKTKGCYLFKPTENTYNSTDDTGSSTYTTDVGTQWLGRKSFYIIPYKNSSDDRSDYQVSFNMKSKGNTGKGVEKSVTITPVSSIFTPWIRGFITVAGSNF